jgi:hypothetical protein
MRRFFQAVLILLFIVAGNTSMDAQVPAIQWGPVNSDASNFYRPTILGEDNEGFFGIWYSRAENATYIEKYYSNWERAYSKKLKLPEFSWAQLEIELVCYVNGRFICLASAYHPAKKKTLVYAIEYNHSTGLQIKPPKILFEVDVEKRSRKGTLGVYVSSDQSKILVNHMAYYKGIKAYKDRFCLYNDSFQLIVERENSVEENDLGYKTFNYVVDNDGTFYFARTYSDGVPYIVSYDAGKDFEKWEEKIDLSELDRNVRVHDVSFTLNPQHDLLIAGLCSKDKLLTGCMFLRIDNESKEAEVTKFHEFDNSFRKQFYRLNQYVADTGGAPIPDYFTNLDLHEKEDGGLVLTTEYIRLNGYNYLIKDIIVINLAADGSLLWNIRIPKNQFLMGKQDLITMLFYGSPRVNSGLYVSHFSTLTKSRLLIFYNEQPDNLLLQDDQKFKVFSAYHKGVPVVASIDLKDGVRTTNTFFDAKKEKFWMQTAFTYKCKSSGDLVFLGQNMTRFKAGKISAGDLQ